PGTGATRPSPDPVPKSTSVKMCAPPYGAPVRGKDEGATPLPGMATGGGSHSGDPAAPATPPTDNSMAKAPAESSSGCTVGNGARSSGLGLTLLALVGLALAR